jgi:hypothetical protein
MRVPGPRTHAAIAVVLCAIISGCAGGGPQQSAQSRCALPGDFSAEDLTVDGAGNLFFAVKSSIVKVRSGGGDRSTISVPRIKGNDATIDALAADSAGNLYAATSTKAGRPIEEEAHQLVRVAAGSLTPTSIPGDVGPFSGLAADNSGNLYGSGAGILMMTPGSSKSSFIYSTDQSTPAIAVDQSGSIYLLELAKGYIPNGGGRVLKFQTANSTPQILPFTVHGWPRKIAVDRNGDVFLAQNTEAIGKGPELQKLAPGMSTPTKLALDRVPFIHSIAADANHLYINQLSDDFRVLSLDGKCQ